MKVMKDNLSIYLQSRLHLIQTHPSFFLTVLHPTTFHPPKILRSFAWSPGFLPITSPSCDLQLLQTLNNWTLRILSCMGPYFTITIMLQWNMGYPGKIRLFAHSKNNFQLNHDGRKGLFPDLLAEQLEKTHLDTRRKYLAKPLWQGGLYISNAHLM